MKRSPLTPPDEFSQAPLYSILPRVGDAFLLIKAKGAFFARKEKLSNQSVDISSPESREAQKKSDSEVRMLTEILSFIEERSP